MNIKKKSLAYTVGSAGLNGLSFRLTFRRGEVFIILLAPALANNNIKSLPTTIIAHVSRVWVRDLSGGIVNTIKTILYFAHQHHNNIPSCIQSLHV